MYNTFTCTLELIFSVDSFHYNGYMCIISTCTCIMYMYVCITCIVYICNTLYLCKVTIGVFSVASIWTIWNLTGVITQTV